MVASALFPIGKKGIYVDLGAHHPVNYSNTYHFYLRGWSGLVVDATPKLISQFSTLRPRDISVCACLGPEPDKELIFHRFNESAYDTVDPTAATTARSLAGVKIIERVVMRTRTLDQLLDKYLPQRAVDLLSIDVEGMDEAILRTFDWSRCKPRVIIFEYHGMDLRKVADNGLLSFMFAQNYELYGKCGLSIVMRQNSVAPAVLQ